MSKRIGGRTKLLLQDFAVVVALAVALAGVQVIPRVDTPTPMTSAESSAQAFADAAVGAFAESEAGSDPLLTAEQRSAGLPLRPVDGLSTNTPAGTIQVVLPGGLDEAVKTKTGQVVYPASDAGFDLMAENTADGARTVARINGPNGVRAVTMFVRTPADTVMLAHTNGYLTINRATPSAEAVGVVSPSEARDANGDIVHSAYVVRQYAPGLYQLSEVIAPTDKTAWPVYIDPPISVPQISFSSLTDAMGSVVSAVGDAAQTVASATVSATTATVNFVKANPLESAMLVGGVALSLTGVGGPAGAAMIAGAAVNVSAEVVSVVAAHNPTNAFLGEVSTVLDVTTMFTPQGAAKKVVKEGVEFAVEQTGKHVDDVVDVAKATPTPPAQLSQQISDTPKIPNAPPAKTVPCAGQSFTPETPVVMADGSVKPIGRITTGDRVLSSDPARGWTGSQVVQAVLVNHDTDLLDVTIRGQNNQAVIHTTSKHPFYSAAPADGVRRLAASLSGADSPTGRGAGWVDAQDLRAGDRLYTDDGANAQFVNSATVVGEADMWDLTVSETHAFYVATPAANVLVHNCPAPKPPEGLPSSATPTTPEVPIGQPTPPGVRPGNIPHDQRVSPATPAQRAAAGNRNADRNGGTRECLYCGQPIEKGETEHIVARARGGTNDDTNLDRACVSCNRAKSDKDVDEFLDRKGFTPSEKSRQVIDDAIRAHQQRLASRRPTGPAELRQQQQEQFRDAVNGQRSDAIESARTTSQSHRSEPGSKSGTQSSQRNSESKKSKKQGTAHKHRKGQK